MLVRILNSSHELRPKNLNNNTLSVIMSTLQELCRWRLFLTSSDKEGQVY